MESNYEDVKVITSMRNLNEHIHPKIKAERQHPRIIAMKGNPYTGKTTCANIISNYLKCPVIRLDDILEALSTSVSSASEVDRLTDIAFETALRLLMLQVSVLQTVIIDSPLTSPRHLHQFLHLQDLPVCRMFRFLVVECVPENQYMWELNLREVDVGYFSKWYKPNGWADAKIQSRHFHLPRSVSRLQVHTYGYAMLEYLGPAAMDITSCPEGHDYHFCEWFPLYPVHPEFVASFSCEHQGLHLWEELDTSTTNSNCECRACGNPILKSDDAYACRICGIALHLPCAALKEKMMIPSNELPSFLKRSPPSDHRLTIPQEYRHKCSSCEECSTECGGCLWESHLRSGLVPTIIQPNGCKHSKIFFWITSKRRLRKYICKFCGLPGEFCGYISLSGGAKFNFHVECALLPNPALHTHGGYKHAMELQREERVECEDYLCDICLLPRNPHAFFYYCDQCKFSTHTYCIFEEEV